MKGLALSTIACVLLSVTAHTSEPCVDQPPQPVYTVPSYKPVPTPTYAIHPQPVYRPAQPAYQAPQPVYQPPQPVYVAPTYQKSTGYHKPAVSYTKPVPQPGYAPVKKAYKAPAEPAYAAKEEIEDRTSAQYFKDLQKKKLAAAAKEANGQAISDIRDDSDLPKGYNHPSGDVRCYHSLHGKYSKKVKKAVAGTLGAVAGGVGGSVAGGFAGTLLHPVVGLGAGVAGGAVGAVKGARTVSHAISFEGNAVDCLYLGGQCCSGDILGRSGIALGDELENEQLQCNHCWGAFHVKE